MKLQLLLAITALAILIVACGSEPATPDPVPTEDATTDVQVEPVDEQTLTEIDGLVTELDELDAELNFSDLDALDEELDFS